MMMFKPRNILLLLSLLLLVSLAAVVAYRYRSPANVGEIVKALPDGVDLALSEIRYSHTEKGVERWRLVAGRVEHRAADKMTGVRNLELTFFDVAGREQGTLKANNGVVNADFSEIVVRDQVEIIIPNGYRVQTSHLTYTQSDRILRTDAPVDVVGSSLSLTGVGMYFDVEKKLLKIHDRVRARFQRATGKQVNS